MIVRKMIRLSMVALMVSSLLATSCSKKEDPKKEDIPTTKPQVTTFNLLLAEKTVALRMAMQTSNITYQR